MTGLPCIQLRPRRCRETRAPRHRPGKIGARHSIRNGDSRWSSSPFPTPGDGFVVLPLPLGEGWGEGRLLSDGARALTLTLSLRERGSEGAGLRNDQAKSVIVTKPVVWNVVIESTTSGTCSIEIVSVTMVSGTSLPDATMFNIAG